MTLNKHTRIAAYYDAMLPRFAHDHTGQNARHGAVKVKLSSIVKRGENILDLGCGTGITSKFMAQLGANVTAVDISPKLIEYASKESAHKNVKYYEGDITEIDYARDYLGNPRRFDGIVMVDVFEHIPRSDINRLMQNIKHHSADHTWLFLNIPDGRYQKAAHEYIPDRLQIIDEGYSISWLLDEFGEYGFEAMEIDIYGVDAPCQYNSILFIRKEKMNVIHGGFTSGL